MAVKSPPMFAISKLSRVTLVRFGIQSKASCMDRPIQRVLMFVVALKISAAVYSRVSLSSLREEEQSMPLERAYDGKTFITPFIVSPCSSVYRTKRITKTELAAKEPKIKWMNIVQFCAVDSFQNKNDVAQVKGTIAKGYPSKSVQLSGKSKLKTLIIKMMKADTSSVLTRSKEKLTSQ